MSLDELKQNLPEYARDLKLNLGSLVNETLLEDSQKWGCFLACAHAIGEPDLLRAVQAEIDGKLSKDQIRAAKAASAMMGMNNIYYRFVHLASNDQYKTLPARLRMNIIANPGVGKESFELWSLAVSAINGCGMCIDAHEKTLREHKVSAEQVQAAVRIASVLHAVAAVLLAESV